MDAMQSQITTLNHKVDGLYQIVEQLNHQVSELLSETKRMPGTESDFSSFRVSERRYSSQVNSRVDMVLSHKDVLADSNYLDTGSQNREKELSPEIQIQRLTAQLTAAYNRIAALEEQLLAQRVH